MDKEKVDNLLVSGINYAYWGLLFFLPLLMWTTASEVFEFPKMLLVYGMTVVICGMWLARMVINRKVLIAKTPLDIPILLFLLSQIVSTFYSIEPHTSWWGYYSRFHGGLMSTIAYTLLYYAFISNKKQESRVKSQEVIAILASGVIVATYAILQHFGIDKDFWVQDVMNRVFSTQGQPNWLAAMMVMVIPFFFTVATDNSYKRYKSYNRLYWGGLMVCFLTLLWTKSRSGLIGLGVESIVLGLFMLSSKRKKVIGLIGIIGLIWIISTSWWSRTPRRDDNQGTESGDIRKIVWRGTVELIKRYPLFGTGPETFAYTYWWVRPVEHNYTSEWNFLYNKAHNEWLNLAANTGLVGLGSHLLLLGWFSFYILKKLRDKQFEILNLKFEIASLASLWGVEIVNILGFSTVTVGTYTYLFMAIAVMTGSSTSNTGSKSNTSTTNKAGQIWEIGGVGGIGVIGGYLLIQIFIMFIADLGYNKGRQYVDAGYVEEALPILTNVVRLVPDEPVFREELAEAQAVTYEEMAVNNFKIVRKQNPYQVPFLRSQGKYIFALGEVDNSLYERGIELILQSIELAPTDPRGYYQLGIFYEQLGEEEKAKGNYQKALELKSDYMEVRAKLSN